MAELTIRLSDSQKTFVKAEVATGDFGSESAYIADLIRKAQIRKERDRINAALLEAIESGEATPMTKQDWADIRRRVNERLATYHRKKKAKKTQKVR